MGARQNGRLGHTASAIIVFLLFGARGNRTSAQDREVQLSDNSRTNLWRAGVGEGFRKGATEIDAVAGAGLGVRVLENHTHDWAMGALDFGWVFTDVVGDKHWYRGNWELIGEIFGGAQFRPDDAYF